MTAKRKPKAKTSRKPRRRPAKAKRPKVVKATECKTTHEMVEYQTKAPTDVTESVMVRAKDVSGTSYVFPDSGYSPQLPASLAEDLKSTATRKSWWTRFLDWLSEG